MFSNLMPEPPPTPVGFSREKRRLNVGRPGCFGNHGDENGRSCAYVVLNRLDAKPNVAFSEHTQHDNPNSRFYTRQRNFDVRFTTVVLPRID